LYRKRANWGNDLDSNDGPPVPTISLDESRAMLAAHGISTRSIPKLSNVVVTCDAACRLDCQYIARHMRNAEYKPRRFAAVIVRIREPKATALIFSTGKIVCVGNRCVDDGRLSCRKFVRQLTKLGFDASLVDFKVQNMVANVDAGFDVRLEGLQANPLHYQFLHWNPELFPGMVYTMVKLRVKAIVFVSGKIILTGAKHEQHIHEAWAQLYSIVKQYAFQRWLPPAKTTPVSRKESPTKLAPTRASRKS
jgi:transcription initiation factor TFIID TATA-box-binding protein